MVVTIHKKERKLHLVFQIKKGRKKERKEPLLLVQISKKDSLDRREPVKEDAKQDYRMLLGPLFPRSCAEYEIQNHAKDSKGNLFGRTLPNVNHK